MNIRDVRQWVPKINVDVVSSNLDTIGNDDRDCNNDVLLITYIIFIIINGLIMNLRVKHVNAS